ncbi:cyclic nucleotide-binding domain-containing protein [Pelagerythrobacter rhizovicinus]|uniref:Cyclic nucleotide-binding domain-containing protein n=1 Tax=Pelagerythrobacter rhizovicinus TaxID=2268576 RepID=A0A4Q2KIM3_9SPHN|nr:hypothetical protein ETX26_10275 [Pelagerythrobacter rhizovicinus]
MLVLSGRLEVRRHDRAGNDAHIITHERGDMMGELAQLSGRPFLINALALTAVEAIAIASLAGAPDN